MAVLDYLKSVQWSPTADAETVFYWTVFDGKTTKEKAETYSFSNIGMSFDIVGVFVNYHWMIMDMYSKNILQPIDTWKDKVMLPGEELLDPENRFPPIICHLRHEETGPKLLPSQQPDYDENY